MSVPGSSDTRGNEPPDSSFVNAGILLAAVDFALCDDMPVADALAFALRQFEATETDPLWANGRHEGDCTNQPMTCNRCFTERYEAEARERWET